MARRHLTRKEIKQPDQFISYTAQTLSWARDHIQRVLYGVVGILIVVGLVFGWFAWRKQRLERAEVLLYEAVKLLHPDDAGTGDTSAKDANRKQAMQQLLSITRDYRGSRVASLAQWYLGHLYFERQDYTAALAAYEQARRGLALDPQQLIPALVTLNIGYAQEASGDCPQALVSFEQVLQSSASWLHGEAYLSMGRCYESTGAMDKALALYDRALSDAEVSGAIRKSIEERQTGLQAQMDHKTADQPAKEPNETK